MKHWLAKTRPVHTGTAAHKLMMLRLPAALGLFVEHLKIRAAHEPLDPVALTNAAHALLEMASQAERQQKRNEQ